MQYIYFNRDDVLEALEAKGYFIHTKTSDDARAEVRKLCEDLSKYLNHSNGFEDDEDDEGRIYLFNSEVPPSCNYGVIRRSDQFSFEPLRENVDKKSLIKEIERTRI